MAKLVRGDTDKEAADCPVSALDRYEQRPRAKLGTQPAVHRPGDLPEIRCRAPG